MITTTDLVRQGIKDGMSYLEYRKLVSNLLDNGQATGPTQNEDLLTYSKLNHQRMKRLDKTIRIPENIKQHLGAITQRLTFLVLTEGWCGDASQSLPVVNKLIHQSDLLDMKILLRDDHLPLMKAFATNGNLAIPKVIIYSHDTDSILGDWGPRPMTATKLVLDYKATQGSLDDQFKKELQVWYNEDKGTEVMKELLSLIQTNVYH